MALAMQAREIKERDKQRLEDARELQRTHKTMDFESDFGVPFWWASQIFGHGLTVYYVLQSQNWFFRISTLGIYFLYPWIRAGDSLEID